jgi:hypothetical protein
MFDGLTKKGNSMMEIVLEKRKDEIDALYEAQAKEKRRQEIREEILAERDAEREYLKEYEEEEKLRLEAEKIEQQCKPNCDCDLCNILRKYELI